jgi:glycine hydroxymethyltransferase
MHVVAAKAVCLQEALAPSFAEYQRQIVKNARALAQGLTGAGLKLTTGGTDNHLMLLDLRGTGATGNVVEDALGQADITVNKNMVPFDPEKPATTSGIRVGTPAVTTRGMKEPEMALIAQLIARVVAAPHDAAKLAAVKREVHELAARFPLYQRLIASLP